MDIKLKDYRTKSDILYTDFIKLQESITSLDDELTQLGLDFINKMVLSIFYTIDSKFMRRLTFEQIEELVGRINNILVMPKSDLKMLFEMDGITYGFIPNFSEITSGELIDMDDCLKQNNYIELTSILYREVIGKVNKKGEYRIKEYEGYDRKFEKVSLDIVEGYMDFFMKSYQILKNNIPTSTLVEKDIVKKEMV